MSDADVLSGINELVAEGRELLDEAAKSEAPRNAHPWLEHLQITLDQSWELLRQRRAQREFGGDPDTAEPRFGNDRRAIRAVGCQVAPAN